MANQIGYFRKKVKKGSSPDNFDYNLFCAEGNEELLLHTGATPIVTTASAVANIDEKPISTQLGKKVTRLVVRSCVDIVDPSAGGGQIFAAIKVQKTAKGTNYGTRTDTAATATLNAANLPAISDAYEADFNSEEILPGSFINFASVQAVDGGAGAAAGSYIASAFFREYYGEVVSA